MNSDARLARIGYSPKALAVRRLLKGMLRELHLRRRCIYFSRAGLATAHRFTRVPSRPVRKGAVKDTPDNPVHKQASTGVTQIG